MSILRCVVLAVLVVVSGIASQATRPGGQPAGAAEPAGQPAAATASPAEVDYSAELPRIPPTEPADTLKTFTVAPGFKIEQVAAEPLVNSPVAMEWDENGRLYVCEMRGYSENRDDKLSRISVLDDTDGDGRFDKSTVFIDGLLWPTAVFPFDGGLFVADAPDVYYFKDTDGDGRASHTPEEKKLVLTGFGTSNVQGLLNSFRWNLDNRIEIATGSLGGDIVKGDAPKDARPTSIRGRDLSMHPRTYDFVPTSGASQHGMSFDDWGRKFVSSNSNHIQQVMYEDRYIARNPFLDAPPAKVSIAADGPQAEVFRTSPVEPWRVVRTRLRVSGAVRGAVEGGGRAAGYFTGATGVTIYRGDAFGDEWRGMAVVGDVGSNLVHRKRLEPNGLEFIAKRIDENSEFVSSSDIWFRPAQFANAPDGTLYIMDVYREVIEHPASLPPEIKKHLDLTAGRDRGRIYRVVPAEGFTHRPTPKLGSATTAELVALLEHPNSWHRETAARLIYTRQDKSAIEPLQKLARESKSPLGRMHALYALRNLTGETKPRTSPPYIGTHGLTIDLVTAALNDKDSRVRRHATRITEGVHDLTRLRHLVKLADDPDPEVRYQLAFSLGQSMDPMRETFESPGRDWFITGTPRYEVATDGIAKLLRVDSSDRWIRMAAQSSLYNSFYRNFPTLGRVLTQLLDDPTYRNKPGAREMLETLAAFIARKSRSTEIKIAVDAIDSLPESDAALALAMTRGLLQEMKRPNSILGKMSAAGELKKMDAVVATMLAAALKTAGDSQADAKKRVPAIDSLSLGKFADVQATLAKLIDNREPHEVQLAAVAVLGKYDDPAVAEVLLAAWPRLSPQIKEPAAEVLFARPDRTVALFDAVDAGRVPPGDLAPSRLQLLTKSKNEAIRERAVKLFTAVKPGRRQDVVEAYRDVLQLTGDPARGKAAFKKTCSVCHKIEGVGTEIGPNLTAIKTRGPEAVLTNVLDPSREVNPLYVNYVATTVDGRTITGLIAAESAASLTLKRAEGVTDTVLRVDLEELQSTGLSIMPEGLEKQLDKQTLADVIAYLMQVQ